MKLGAAYALAASLHVYVRNETLEGQTLKRLAAWAGRFTPIVSLAPPKALLLEIGGSLAIFGGVERLTQTIREQVTELGYQLTLAVAPTPLGAVLLARAGCCVPVTDHQHLIGMVMQCPVSVLALEQKQTAALYKLGLHTVGDCLRLPRDGLARRLGTGIVKMLDQALGRIADPRQSFVAPVRFKSSLLLPAEVEDAQALLFAVHRLLLELTGVLESRDSGAQSLLLTLKHNDKHDTSVVLNLVKPVNNLQTLLELFRERFHSLRLADAVREIVLVGKQGSTTGA